MSKNLKHFWQTPNLNRRLQSWVSCVGGNYSPHDRNESRGVISKLMNKDLFIMQRHGHRELNSLSEKPLCFVVGKKNAIQGRFLPGIFSLSSGFGACGETEDETRESSRF